MSLPGRELAPTIDANRRGELKVHVLTKIFIVLVSLLALLLVPLVVVYAYNEDSVKAKYLGADAQAATAVDRLGAAQAVHAAENTRLQLEIQELKSEQLALAKERDVAAADIREMQIELAGAESQQAKIRADLAKLASGVSAGQELMGGLLSEVRTMRSDALAAERRAVELDEALRDRDAQLEVAVAARRALQEELQQLREGHAKALEQLAMYVTRFGELGEMAGRSGRRPAPPIDRDLDAQIINVRRSSNQKLAEINAGSRDGVKEGWELTIGRGGTFIGKLRIISVDINRSTGIVELESEERGRVEPGDRVYGRAGRG
ncbi:MAG: hypothetical protein O6768_00955 [Planctomycetota bacterium]|nr:hypothetical protein [Planctomycetota bacterium]